jgi:transcriptional regulator with XRE-family HTH domain
MAIIMQGVNLQASAETRLLAKEQGACMGDGGANQAVAARRLRTELRDARVAAGLTQEQVAEAMDVSPSKIIRIENGSVKVSKSDLEAMLNHYKIVDDAKREELLALGGEARKRSWWSQYRQVAAKGMLEFIQEESAASGVISFQPLLVPGLLQTEQYAHSSIRSLDPRLTTKQVDARVELRMRRQELFRRDDPPQMHFILGEAVVRTLVGGKEVMRGQIRHLIDRVGESYMTVQIVPFSAGIHFGMLTPFVVLEFQDEGDHDVLYLENPDFGLIIRDKPDEIRVYRQAFEQLGKISLEASDSVAYLSMLAHEMT